ncbi:bifunctional metallophosphatase/5'-nucleotidase [Tolumonas osonensis]|uniref:5'-nucleotidase n=1 Tax=Tolumonas osonensis TaxID=675874 RepID=A0A841GI36_9GAMM|nr:bifunctional UDP-sugar hydrolase/5'-nucleotidase [Tolumonas osonensis]MBB6054162.1 5'-nucleotidase [Tolumonas osonensis]
MSALLGRFYLAHINDTHSHFDETALPLRLALPDGHSDIRLHCGGFPRLAGFIKQARQRAITEQMPFLLLDAGDSFQGTLYFSCFKGQANAALLNQLGVDAMVVGNHELDTGNTPLANFLRQIRFPLLAANWDLAGEAEDKPTRMQNHPRMVSWQNPAHPKPYIVKWMNDVPVAVFGLVLDNMPDIAAPDGDSTFLPVVEMAKKVIAEIHAAGIEHIILLSHLGYPRDCQLAQEVEGISLIVGGHTHTLQGDFSAVGLADDHPYGERFNQTLVLQAGYNSLMVGLAHIALLTGGRMRIEEGGNVLLTSEDANLQSQHGDPLFPLQQRHIRRFLRQLPNVMLVRPDTAMERLIARHYRSRLSRYTSDQVVSLPRGLRHVRIPDERGGSQVAPLVAEAMLFQAREMGINAEVAIFNAGGARISLPPGPVSAAELAGRLLPFASTVSHFEVRGGQLRQALEGAIVNALELGGSGSFPYPADLRYSYHARAPRGQRVEHLHVRDRLGRWQLLDERRDYRLITTSYTAMGKEGYHALLEQRSEPELLGLIISDVFINYARTRGILIPPAESLYQLNLERLVS